MDRFEASYDISITHEKSKILKQTIFNTAFFPQFKIEVNVKEISKLYYIDIAKIMRDIVFFH